MAAQDGTFTTFDPRGSTLTTASAPAHTSPAMLALCAERPNLPPVLRARFCPAISTSAQTQPPSKNLLLHRHDGALTTSNVPGAMSAQFDQSAAAAGLAAGASYILPPLTAVGTFVTFDVPGAVNGTSPASINNSGAITGGYGDNIGSGSHGFIRDANGSFVTFDVPGAVNFTSPASINNGGAITGGYGDNIGSGYHGFIRDANGSFVTFDVVSDVNYVFGPSTINERGEVAGAYFDGVTFIQHCFLREPNGALTTFDPPGAVNGSFPTTITSDGVILGVYYDADYNSLGFLRDSNGRFTEVTGPGGLTGQSDSYVYWGAGLSITPGGEIAGTYFQPIPGNPFGGDYRVFLLSRNGQYTTFDAADYPPCCIFSSPTGINPAGTVTGVLNDGHDLYRGFLRTSDGTVTLLDAPGAGTGHFQGTVTVGITPGGLVAGIYLGPNDGNFLGYPHGHGFLFVPQNN
jgi:hypothetical protein